MKASVGFEGKYRIKLQNPDGSLRESYEFPNLITDLGLNGIGTNGTSWVTTVAFGTGTAVPIASDSSVSGTVVTTTTTGTSVTGYEAGPPPYTYIIYRHEFAQGVATGNWTEIGIGRNSTTLWSRALILDSGGTATTLTIIATDIVTVEYELRAYPSTTDVTGTRVIGGVSYNYTLRPSILNSYANFRVDAFVSGSWMSKSSSIPNVFADTIGAITGSPSGVSAFAMSSSVVASIGTYINESYTKSITFPSTISEANVGGGFLSYRAMLGPSSGTMYYQCGFSSAIPKTNESIMSMTFSITWARRP